MKKKLLYVGLVLGLSAALCGCGKKTTPGSRPTTAVVQEITTEATSIENTTDNTTVSSETTTKEATTEAATKQKDTKEVLLLGDEKKTEAKTEAGTEKNATGNTLDTPYFTLTFSDKWSGKYSVEPSSSNGSEYWRVCLASGGEHKPHLFTMSVHEPFSDYVNMPDYRDLGWVNGKDGRELAVIVSFPTDVQFDDTNQAEYQSLFNDIDTVLKTLVLKNEVKYDDNHVSQGGVDDWDFDNNGYSDEQLCILAKAHYRVKHGHEPMYADITEEYHAIVTIHLYDIVDDHTATCDWYGVGRYDGCGTDMLGDFVDLNDPWS